MAGPGPAKKKIKYVGVIFFYYLFSFRDRKNKKDEIF
jgi:ABC-type Fe3+ transport system substrate-binding protein